MASTAAWLLEASLEELKDAAVSRAATPDPDLARCANDLCSFEGLQYHDSPELADESRRARAKSRRAASAPGATDAACALDLTPSTEFAANAASPKLELSRRVRPPHDRRARGARGQVLRSRGRALVGGALTNSTRCATERSSRIALTKVVADRSVERAKPSRA